MLTSCLMPPAMLRRVTPVQDTSVQRANHTDESPTGRYATTGTPSPPKATATSSLTWGPMSVTP